MINMTSIRIFKQETARTSVFTIAKLIRFLALAQSLFVLSLSAKDFHVFFLGGQSNMEGHGYVEALPDELKEPVSGVYIFNGRIEMDGLPPAGEGNWAPLEPGHGKDFSLKEGNNELSNRFGPELTFGRKMKELYPEKNIAIVKYAKGGTSINPDVPIARERGCWIVDWNGGQGEGQGINQFDHAVMTMHRARAIQDIDGDGEPDRLIPAGIVWLQGESDCRDPLTAARYLGDFTTLMQRLREQFGNRKAPVVVGRIADWEVWTERAIVRAAQEEFVAQDCHAALVTSIDEYGNSDKYHYDSEGYIDLGRQFAEAFRSIDPSKN
jgi:iduronate 2-sulfatase